MTKVFVTPEKARAYLSRNQVNRSLSKDLCQIIAKDIVEGRWVYNGEPIILSNTGILLDGQHRCQGIIIAEGLDPNFRGVEIEVIEGVPEAARDTIDSGRVRSVSDVLHMQGKGHGIVGGGAARIILNYLDDARITAMRSKAERLALIKDFPDILQYAEHAASVRGVIRPSPLAAVLFIGTRGDPRLEELAVSFVRPLNSGHDLSYGDPRLTLRNAFQGRRMTGGGAASSANVGWSFAAVAQAWNAWLAQRELQQVRVQPAANGDILMPDVLGGPARASGRASLDRPVSIPKKLRDILAEREGRDGTWNPDRAAQEAEQMAS